MPITAFSLHPAAGAGTAERARRAPASGLGAAARRVGGVLLFGVLPVVLTLALLGVTYGKSSFVYDFHGGLYGAGQDILHGRSPYRPGYLELQAAVERSGGVAQTVIDVPVYPPPVLLAVAPLSLLPLRLAGLVFIGLSIAATIVALRLLRVRDWRCYGLAFCYWPMLSALRLGALGPLLVLGCAAAWRWRGNAAPTAAALAAVVAAKLFPWMLGGWLLVTKRYRALALAVAFAALGTLTAWAVIGWHGLAAYPHMLANLSFVSEPAGVSLVAGLLALGVGATLAKVLALAAAAVLFGLAGRAVRAHGGDRRAFGLMVIAALTASPMVWPHYLALVLVPIALLSPTLSAIWFVPLLAYFAPVAQTQGDIWEIVPYLAIEAIIVWRLCSSGAPGAARFRTRGVGLNPA